jgi:hypothetical protein
MKIIPSSRRRHYVAKVSIFLIAAALIAGMVGCGPLPIAIHDWYDLNAVRDNLGGGYILMNDLDFTTAGYEELASPTANQGKGWEPIGALYDPSTDPFTGSFDGQGYEIRDLFINRPDEHYVGLFGCVGEGGRIEDIGVVNADVTGFSSVGGLVGENDGTVSNSYSTGSVTGGYVGGLVGKNDGTVSDSYSTGSVTGDYVVGGLVGGNGISSHGTVSNSYSTGSVTGGDHVGGLVGENWGTVSNSYSTSGVTGNNLVGGLVGYNVGGVSSSLVSNSYATGGVIGSYGVGGLVGGNDGSTVSDSYSTGNVTGDLGVGGLVGGSGSGTVSNSYATGSVTGNEYVGGLVGANDETTVSSSYSSGNVAGNTSVGGLVGFNYDSIVSNSFYNYDEVLVLINGEVENILTIGALSGEDFDQWLANDKFLDINERLSQENGYYVVNNIADFKELLAFGQDNSLKFRLKNDLDLATEPNFYIPYFAGEFDGNGHKISNLSFDFNFVSHVGLFGCLAPGGKVTQVGVENVNITGNNFVGGLVGENDGTVSYSYSTGSVTGNEYVSGLVGRNVEGTVSDSHSTGSATGNEYVGGLVGYNYGTVSNSYSTGSVTGNNLVGGLVGFNGWSTVSNSYSSGSVIGGDDVGGLVGRNAEATVSNSYSSSSVIGNRNVGGLVGNNGHHGTVSNSYSTGSVTGGNETGGLVGDNGYYGTVTDSYSTGSVTGDVNVGGLVGRSVHGTASDSFWDTEASGQATSDGGTGKNTTEMQDIATFSGAGWNIIAVTDPGTRNTSYTWNIVDDETYPFLSWKP